jgi:hypothetical protein
LNFLLGSTAGIIQPQRPQHFQLRFNLLKFTMKVIMVLLNYKIFKEASASAFPKLPSSPDRHSNTNLKSVDKPLVCPPTPWGTLPLQDGRAGRSIK